LFTAETQSHRRAQKEVHGLAGLGTISGSSVTEVAENTESSFASGMLVWGKRLLATETPRGKAASCQRSAFSRIEARPRPPRMSETLGCDLGQVVNLRPEGTPGNPPAEAIGWPSAARPQDAILSAWRCAPPKGMKTRRGRLPIGRRMPSGPTCAPECMRFSTVPHIGMELRCSTSRRLSVIFPTLGANAGKTGHVPLSLSLRDSVVNND
jgi:hypothetical protein